MQDARQLNLDYIRKLYATQDGLLSAIAAKLKEMDVEIQISPEEGKLLQLLIGLHGIKTIVEVGTLAGYSAIWMARALPADGHLYTLEKNPKHAEIAHGFIAQSDVKDRITVLEGDAGKLLDSLNDKAPFDMMFIDADKPGYNAYLDWAEAHVRPGGLIVADNTLLFDTIGLPAPPEGTAPSTWHGMRLFNDRLADTRQYFSTMIPTDDGLTVAVKLSPA